jgi:hypothetical protein
MQPARTIVLALAAALVLAACSKQAALRRPAHRHRAGRRRQTGDGANVYSGEIAPATRTISPSASAARWSRGTSTSAQW